MEIGLGLMIDLLIVGLRRVHTDLGMIIFLAQLHVSDSQETHTDNQKNDHQEDFKCAMV